MKRDESDRWWLAGNEIRVVPPGPLLAGGGVVAIAAILLLLTLLGGSMDRAAAAAPAGFVVVIFGVPAILAAVLLNRSGRVSVVEGAVEWRPRLGPRRTVFLRGNERVTFKTDRVVVSDGRRRVTVPYRSQGYARLHGLLREQSEIFRAAQDIELPFSIDGSRVKKGSPFWIHAIWLAPVMLAIARRNPLLVMSFAVIFLALAIYTQRLRPGRPRAKIGPRLCRFEAERVAIHSWKGDKWYDPPRLKSVRMRGQVLLLRFEGMPRSTAIPQQQVAYPLPILKEKIEEWYRPRPEEAGAQEDAPGPPAQAGSAALPSPEPDPWDIFG